MGADLNRQAQLIAHRLEQDEQRSNTTRRIVAAGFLVASGAAAWAIGTGQAEHLNFTRSMPFEQELQQAVNSLDGILEGAGEVALPLALGAIGVVKLGASRDTRLYAIDRWSSQEMSSDRTSSHKSLARKGLEATFAGKVPVMAAVGAGLAVFSTAVNTEVSNGPQRPIEKALSELAPGSTMITEYAGAMPMVESDVSRQLTDSVLAQAHESGIGAHLLDEDLGQLIKGKQTLSELSLGIDIPATSPLNWGTANCEQIPVAIDKLAGVKNGESVELNGVNARVVEQITGVSATNRIGVVMDEKAMAACLKKNPEAPVHAIILDTDTATAASLLASANPGHETSAVISKRQYLKNSKDFWVANVKPITNVLAVFSGVFAFAAMGAAMRERLLRNRREWAAKSASGVSDAMIRGTELLRATKDGVVASTVGAGVALVGTPFVVNMLESGFKAGVGLKEVMVGFAVGILGSVSGAARSLIRPQKIINTSENTRV